MQITKTILLASLGAFTLAAEVPKLSDAPDSNAKAVVTSTTNPNSSATATKHGKSLSGNPATTSGAQSTSHSGRRSSSSTVTVSTSTRRGAAGKMDVDAGILGLAAMGALGYLA